MSEEKLVLKMPRWGLPLYAQILSWFFINAVLVVFTNWQLLSLVGVGLLVLSGLVWLPFVLQVTRRLRLMTEGAERISEGDFQVNVASNRGDEIGRLSRVIQRMSGRLGVLVDGQKRFRAGLSA